jgi:hypothetical protein
MAMNTSTFNAFLFYRLPSAWWCGVRLSRLGDTGAETTVKYRWINQNPFKSMFWAVQGMAAELSTGALVIEKIRSSGKDISMLLIGTRAQFSKKATGRITFACEDGILVDEMLQKAVAGNEGQIFCMKSVGRNQEGLEVARFEFEWSVKARGGK